MAGLLGGGGGGGAKGMLPPPPSPLPTPMYPLTNKTKCRNISVRENLSLALMFQHFVTMISGQMVIIYLKKINER